MLILSPLKALNDPTVVIPTPVQAAQPLGVNGTTAMTLVTSLLYAGGLALADIPMAATARCIETPETGPAGPVAAGAPAGHSAKAGSLTKA